MKKSDEFFEFEIKNGNGDKMKNPLNKKIWDLKRESSLLVLYPNNEKNRKSGPRELFIKIFGDDFKLLEAIDNELFYKYSTLFDKSNCQNIEENINTVLAKCYTKKGINKWFNNSTLQSDELTLFNAIQLKIEKLSIKIDNNQISDVLRSIHSLGGMKCIRKEVIYSLIAALQNSDIDKCSVFEAMVNKRNTIRRIGRKVIGKCVGTTLLTKGLEFDTVAIMNAHEFDCPKHLYVALTRACKRLIVFTSNPILKPYK